MNPIPIPPVPGKTEFERFDNLFRKIIAVPKSAIAEQPKPKYRKKRSKPNENG